MRSSSFLVLFVFIVGCSLYPPKENCEVLRLFRGACENPKGIDFVFLIDSDNSANVIEYAEMKDFLRNIVQSIRGTAHLTILSLVGNEIDLKLAFRDPQDQWNWEKSIDSLEQSSREGHFRRGFSIALSYLHPHSTRVQNLFIVVDAETFDEGICRINTATIRVILILISNDKSARTLDCVQSQMVVDRYGQLKSREKEVSNFLCGPKTENRLLGQNYRRAGNFKFFALSGDYLYYSKTENRWMAVSRKDEELWAPNGIDLPQEAQWSRHTVGGFTFPVSDVFAICIANHPTIAPTFNVDHVAPGMDVDPTLPSESIKPTKSEIFTPEPSAEPVLFSTTQEMVPMSLDVVLDRRSVTHKGLSVTYEITSPNLSGKIYFAVSPHPFRLSIQNVISSALDPLECGEEFMQGAHEEHIHLDCDLNPGAMYSLFAAADNRDGTFILFELTPSISDFQVPESESSPSHDIYMSLLANHFSARDVRTLTDARTLEECAALACSMPDCNGLFQWTKGENICHCILNIHAQREFEESCDTGIYRIENPIKDGTSHKEEVMALDEEIELEELQQSEFKSDCGETMDTEITVKLQASETNAHQVTIVYKMDHGEPLFLHFVVTKALDMTLYEVRMASLAACDGCSATELVGDTGVHFFTMDVNLKPGRYGVWIVGERKMANTIRELVFISPYGLYFTIGEPEITYMELSQDSACLGLGRNLGLVYNAEDCAYLVSSYEECGDHTFSFLARGEKAGLCHCIPPDKECDVEDHLGTSVYEIHYKDNAGTLSKFRPTVKYKKSKQQVTVVLFLMACFAGFIIMAIFLYFNQKNSLFITGTETLIDDSHSYAL